MKLPTREPWWAFWQAIHNISKLTVWILVLVGIYDYYVIFYPRSLFFLCKHIFDSALISSFLDKTKAVVTLNRTRGWIHETLALFLLSDITQILMYWLLFCLKLLTYGFNIREMSIVVTQRKIIHLQYFNIWDELKTSILSKLLENLSFILRYLRNNDTNGDVTTSIFSAIFSSNFWEGLIGQLWFFH